MEREVLYLMGKPWNPEEYDAWYKTSLGAFCDKLEKELVSSLLDVRAGEKALDVWYAIC